MVYDLIDKIELPEVSSSKDIYSNFTTSSMKISDKSRAIARQYGKDQISLKSSNLLSTSKSYEYISSDSHETEETTKDIKRMLIEKLDRQLLNLTKCREIQEQDKEFMNSERAFYDSAKSITPKINKPMKHYTLENIVDKDRHSKLDIKSDFKSIGIQTEKKKKRKDGTHKVQVKESKSVSECEDPQPSTENVRNEDKETQTARKEKED